MQQRPFPNPFCSSFKMLSAILFTLFNDIFA
jgi:hypothetical protein